MTPNPPFKPCVVCGREITWRKKWERDWDQVKYCSARCRRARLDEKDQALERAIVELLSTRAAGATICPSEAAKRCDPANWEALIERARAAARRLAGEGKIELCQGGQVVDPSRARGPIRLRRPG